MPRNRGAGRAQPKPISRGPPPSALQKVKQSPRPPQSVQPSSSVPAQPSGIVQRNTSGSVLGGVAGTIAEGVAFGTGSAIAHRAADAVLGPRVMHEYVTRSTDPQLNQLSDQGDLDPCMNLTKSFQECIATNQSDIGRCQIYVDLLKECQRGASVNGL
ncbi:hypothetical protein O6H91_Y559800 [Diphasiastrum complanatum]|nr:hypothetical protein O6H91_Y559800 [Diphasiastrum complanatum]